MKKIFCLLGISLMLFVFPLKAIKSGSIEGKVSEDFRKIPVSGVLVMVVNKSLSTLTNEKGEFKILNVPVGSYNVKFSASGYQTIVLTDIIVRSDRITNLNVILQEDLLPLKETMEVTARYFHEDPKVPTSVFNLSPEEIRRAPGSVGGLGRMLKALPGITTRTDDINELIVRGGSPLENGFYIDGIEVPGINHIPFQGTSGGFYSALDPDLLQNVDFISGGFPAEYGGHLSSITDITLREGNRKEFDGQFMLSFFHVGGILEGPISKGKGSWLISFRKAALDLMRRMKLVLSTEEVLPDTFDAHIKFTLDISPKHKINALLFHVSGDFLENSPEYINILYQHKQDSIGINLVSTWSENFFSTTSLSYSSLTRIYGENYTGGDDIWNAEDKNGSVNLRNSNILNLNQRNRLEFGLQLKHEFDKVDYIGREFTDINGNVTPGYGNSGNYNTTKLSLFFSYIGSPLLKRLTTTFGLRFDYSSAQNVFHLSPRFSLIYKFNEKVSLNGGFGIFYQTIPINYLANIPDAVNVKDMKATHYTLGLNFFPGPGTKISIDAYYKKYDHLPVSPDFPYVTINDWVMDSQFDEHAPNGYKIPTSIDRTGTTGYSRGIELFLQQKLIKKFYFILNATFFRSLYQDLLGVTRDRMFDNRYITNLLVGFKPSRKWEFSVNWTTMGGGPYTPTDIEESARTGQWLFDNSRYNEERYPVYSSVNFRVDRRWFIGKTSLIIFLDIWNLFDRENVWYYWWDRFNNTYGEVYKLSTLTILGLEFEF